MADMSLAIVSYKNKTDITECLSSLYAFVSPKDIDVYIINNSQFGDLDSLAIKFPVKIIQGRGNVGFGAGHNQVIPFLVSRYHAIVNPDIIFTENPFKEILSFMKSHEDVGCVSPIMYSSNGKMQPVYRREISLKSLFCRYMPMPFAAIPYIKKCKMHQTMSDVEKTHPFECEFIQGSFLVVKTEMFKGLQGFDERFFMYAEDADLCKRIRKTHKVMCDPNCRIVHKWEKQSHRNLKLLNIHVQSLIKYINKWGWK